jgi:VWFA-related protein
VRHLPIVVVALCFPIYAQVSNSAPASPASSGNAVSAPNGQSRRVMVLVTATDHSGSPLAQQLSDKDLSVLDNQQPAEVVSVQPASQLPLRVAFLLLAGNTGFGQQQTAAIELARKVLRPNIDRSFVITARGDKSWANPRLDWQNDANSLEKAVRALDKNAGFADEFSFDMSTYDAGMNRHLTILRYGDQGTSAFSVLWAMMKSDPTAARRVVVMFRDAWGHSPGFGGPYTQAVEENHTRLIADAQRLWTSFYVIAVEQPQQVSKELTGVYAPTHSGEGGYNRVYDQNLERARDHAYTGGKANLDRMASETGGAVWWNAKKNYSDAVAGVANMLKAQYAVTYAVHSDPSAGLGHELVIKSLNSGIRVAAQKAYFSRQAPTPTVGSQAASQQLQPPAAASVNRH